MSPAWQILRTRSLQLVCAALACVSCSASAPQQSAPVWVSVESGSDDSSSSFYIDVAKVNEPGQQIDVTSVLVPGKVTLVAFYADWCAPCRRVERAVFERIRSSPQVAVRKINIGENVESPVARQNEVDAVPLLRIYDARGNRRHSLEGREAYQAGEIILQMTKQMQQ